MDEYKYKEMIKMKCNELAYKYLMNRRGSKGKEIEYKSIQMSQYLQPNNVLEISEQKKIFEVRNKMTIIPANFSGSKENKCVCLQKENMEHIYHCRKLNANDMEVKYENIYKGNVENMKFILNRFFENMRKREEFSHVIQNCDPPVLI